MLFPENEWFWQTATTRLSDYLGGRKAIPSRTELLVESFGETIEEHTETAKNLATKAADAVEEAGSQTLSVLKTGALILGGVAAAALVLPPIVRTVRDREPRRTK